MGKKERGEKKRVGQRKRKDKERVGQRRRKERVGKERGGKQLCCATHTHCHQKKEESLRMRENLGMREKKTGALFAPYLGENLLEKSEINSLVKNLE